MAATKTNTTTTNKIFTATTGTTATDSTRSNTMHKRNGKGVKRRNERNILTFYEKIAVIRYYDETNISRNSLAKMFHCCATQIRRILDRKDELLQQLATLSEADASLIIEEMTRKRRKFEMSAISFILHQWVERCRQMRLRKSITNLTLKETALKMAAILNLPAFRPSYRWLNRFRGKYRYNDEDLGVGATAAGAATTAMMPGELSVEDIIIEFKDSLPNFMQKEISAITSSAGAGTGTGVNGVVNKMSDSLMVDGREKRPSYNQIISDDDDDDDDDDVIEIITDKAEQQLPKSHHRVSSSEISPSPSTSPHTPQPPQSQSNNDDAAAVRDADSPATSTVTDADALEMRICAATTAVLSGVFPHLAVIHQFALLNSDAKALELISQLGVHMQTQATEGAYKQLSLATTTTSATQSNSADQQTTTTSSSAASTANGGYAYDLDDIILIE